MGGSAATRVNCKTCTSALCAAKILATETGSLPFTGNQLAEPSALPYPLIDIHTHLMPERLFQAVRAYFRAHLWHPRYEGPIDELVETLLAGGGSRVVLLAYAHQIGR